MKCGAGMQVLLGNISNPPRATARGQGSTQGSLAPLSPGDRQLLHEDDLGPEAARGLVARRAAGRARAGIEARLRDVGVEGQEARREARRRRGPAGAAGGWGRASENPLPDGACSEGRPRALLTRPAPLPRLPVASVEMRSAL